MSSKSIQTQICVCDGGFYMSQQLQTCVACQGKGCVHCDQKGTKIYCIRIKCKQCNGSGVVN